MILKEMNSARMGCLISTRKPETLDSKKKPLVTNPNAQKQDNQETPATVLRDFTDLPPTPNY